MVRTNTARGDEALQQAIETRFECARCGHCCKGDGVVRIGEAEAERMARALGLTRRKGLATYAIANDRHQWVLRDRLVPVAAAPGGYEKWCVFLERDGDGLYACQLGEAKPDQCHSFPARWRNLDSVQTCLGLRLLTRALRQEAETAASSQ